MIHLHLWWDCVLILLMQALRILDHQLSNHKDTVLGLAPRFVVQLCEQSLASP